MSTPHASVSYLDASGPRNEAEALQMLDRVTWKSLNANGVQLLFKMLVSDDTYSIVASDMVHVWAHHADADAVREQMAAFNPDLTLDTKKLLRFLSLHLSQKQQNAQLEVRTHTPHALELYMHSNQGDVDIQWTFSCDDGFLAHVYSTEKEQGKEERRAAMYLRDRLTMPLCVLVTQMGLYEETLHEALEKQGRLVEQYSRGREQALNVEEHLTSVLRSARVAAVRRRPRLDMESRFSARAFAQAHNDDGGAQRLHNVPQNELDELQLTTERAVASASGGRRAGNAQQQQDRQYHESLSLGTVDSSTASSGSVTHLSSLSTVGESSQEEARSGKRSREAMEEEEGQNEDEGQQDKEAWKVPSTPEGNVIVLDDGTTYTESHSEKKRQLEIERTLASVSQQDSQQTHSGSSTASSSSSSASGMQLAQEGAGRKKKKKKKKGFV